jgi:hypothetical protein
MTERHPDLFKILIGEIGQDGRADVVLGKALRVLTETELLKPLRNLLHRGGTPDCRASSARIGKFIRQTRNAVGSIFLASSRARALARRQIAVPDRCQLPQPRGRPCARARGRPVPPEAPPRRNAPAASAGATQAGKGQPAGLKPLNASRARWFDSPRSSRPRFSIPATRAPLPGR